MTVVAASCIALVAVMGSGGCDTALDVESAALHIALAHDRVLHAVFACVLSLHHSCRV